MAEKDDITFGDYVKKFAANTANITEIAERLRTQTSVVLFKRNRGETLGDRIGRWNYGTNNYVEPALTQLSPVNIFTKNIVKKIVRANAAVMSQAPIDITAEPRMQTTRSKKNALISSKLCEYFQDPVNNVWTPGLELQMNEMKQLTQGVFLEAVWDESAPGREYDDEEVGEEAFEVPGMYACPQCGVSQFASEQPEMEQMHDDDPQAVINAEAIESPAMHADVMCDDCGVAMTVIEGGGTETIPTNKRVKKTFHGDNRTKLKPSLEYRVDEQYSQGANIDNLTWAEHHPLMTRFEIERRFKVKDLGSAADWSFANKWLYTLQTGTSYPFKSYRQTQETLKKLELYEVRFLYFTPEWLASYTAGVDWEFKKGDEVVFSIKKGQNARDVVLEMAKAAAAKRKSPVLINGLCVAITGDKILDVYLADFKRATRISYLVSDPVSFWPMCYSELEPMQHLVNQTLTAIGNQIISNQNVLIVDREAYDADDVEGSKNVIYTREGIDKPISNTFGIMPATPVTGDSWRMVDWADASADEVGLTSKEIQGQPSEAETFGQARLNRDQSVGVLTPAQQSTAQAKVGIFRHHCTLAQMHWPFARLKEICDTTNGIINDEDIDAWYESNLDVDVVYSYRPGSEMPKSYTERQNEIADISNFIAGIVKMAPDVMTPQLGVELIGRATQYSSLEDLDIQNIEKDTEVAEDRYAIIVEGLERETEAILNSTNAPEGDIMMLALAQVMQNPLLYPLPQENHIVASEFYRDKSLDQYRKEMPDLAVVAGCQEMIERHRQALVAQGQTVVKTKMEIEAPVQEAQMQQQAAMAETQNAQQQQALALQAATAADQNELEHRKIDAEQERTAAEQGGQVIQAVINAEAASGRGN